MDLDKIIYELEEVEAVFSLFSCLYEDAKIKDVSLVSLDYRDKVKEIIVEIRNELYK